MLPHRIEDISADSVRALVGEAENLTLDFKRELPLSGREDRREFLADIVAMANSEGGDIVIGVTEERDNEDRMGTATGVPGIDCNPDSIVLRLDNLIRDGVAPRLSGVRVAAIEVADGRFAIVVRIRKSWSGPHMVNLGDSRFYGRSNRGKFSLDIAQIRAAFLASDGLRDRIRLFRDERIGKVLSDDTPVPLRRTASALLHVVPASLSLVEIDVRDFHGHAAALCAPTEMSPLPRYNLDGLCFAPPHRDRARNYLQCFRNGTIEFADAFYLPMRRPGYETSVNTQDFERIIIEQVAATIEVLTFVGLPGPFIVLLSVIGVKGWTLDWWDELNGSHFNFDRDVVALPDVVIENEEIDCSLALRPLFDAFWQSAGTSHSRGYRNDRWVGWRG